MNSLSMFDYSPQIARIQRVLDYIEKRLDQVLTVDGLAAQSCWSRWQFQRVFVKETGLTVAQYVRGRRLSHAAKLLLSSSRRHLDIALSCGFESEISFNRAFRKEFGCPPGEYRKRGHFSDIRQPLALSRPDQHSPALTPKLVQVKIKKQPATVLYGMRSEIRGLFSDQPDFDQVIPQTWLALSRSVSMNTLSRYNNIGVVDLNQRSKSDLMPYWACLENPDPAVAQQLERIDIPEQQYAVIPFAGHVKDFDKTLEWFICSWLPQSGYREIYGYELEHYGKDFNVDSEHSYMEYWIPIEQPF